MTATPRWQPAAELDRDVDCGADLRYGLAVDRPPGNGAVEIDDVEPLRAGLHPTARSRRGIAVIRRLAIEIALDETHAATAPDVDCRIEDHVETLASLPLAFVLTPSTQPAISRRPAGPLFSGWNCVPQT